VVFTTIGDVLKGIEDTVQSLQASGGTLEETLTGPGPEVWVRGGLGADFTGYRVRLSSKDDSSGIYLWTLHKIDGHWKITT
jgi:hypothetical protein